MIIPPETRDTGEVPNNAAGLHSKEFPVSVRIPMVLAGLALTLPLSACGTVPGASGAAGTTATVTVTQVAGATPPRATDVVNASRQWTGGPDGTGIFSVGNQPRDGLAASIPPGRYTVQVAPGAKHGHWMVCGSAVCGPGFQEYATVVGSPTGADAAAMYIGPSARTIWLNDVVLSSIAD